MKKILILGVQLILLAACRQTEMFAPTPTTAVVIEAETAAEEEQALVDDNEAGAEPEPETATILPEPAATEMPVVEAPSEETAVPAIEPIKVTYFTPSQQEGPYYTVNKPEDRDNDLVDFTGASGAPEGQILELGGKVYDANGLPIMGIIVEIWQTDATGVYLHPNDPDTSSRDPNFQFYGEAVTDAAGGYNFRTILPGLYEPRPRHIHVKVRLDDQELLTTQFYFAGEIELLGDDAAMLITAVPGLDAAGNSILIGERDIVLSKTISNQ